MRTHRWIVSGTPGWTSEYSMPVTISLVQEPFGPATVAHFVIDTEDGNEAAAEMTIEDLHALREAIDKIAAEHADDPLRDDDAEV